MGRGPRAPLVSPRVITAFRPEHYSDNPTASSASARLAYICIRIACPSSNAQIWPGRISPSLDTQRNPRNSGVPQHRYGDSNPGFRTENPAS